MARRVIGVSCAVLLVAATLAMGGRSALQADATGHIRPAALVRVHRIAGADRFDTSARVAAEMPPLADDSDRVWVVIGTGRSFADALAGAPLAAALDAPLLLSDTNNLPASVAAEITRRGATDAILLGGTAALTDTVRGQVDALVVGTPERIGGANRFDTARLIAERLHTVAPETGGRAVVATGRNFPDALAAAGWAGRMGYPILLTEPTVLPTPTQQALTSLGTTSTVVLGGVSAVSEMVFEQLPGAVRIQGSNRYETSKLIAEEAVAEGMSFNQLVVATGVTFPDALAAGPLAAQLAAPTILTLTNDLHTQAQAVINEHGSEIERAILVGGAAAIGDIVATDIDGRLAAAATPWSTPRAVSDAALSATLYPHNVAGDVGRDGAVHILWQEGGTLRYRKLDANGCALVDTVAVRTGLSTTYRSFPAVVADADGGAIAVWKVTSGGATVEGLWGAAYDAAGRVRLAPRRISIVDSRFCSADIGPDGVLRVAVMEMDDPNRPLIGMFSAEGLTPVMSFTPLTGVGRDVRWARTPSVLARADGLVDVAWLDARDETLLAEDYHDVYASRLSAIEGGFASPGAGSFDQLRVGHIEDGFWTDEDSSNSAGDSYAPGVAVDEFGFTHIAWMDGYSDVYYARLAPDGSVAVPQSCVVDVVFRGAGTTMDPRVSVLPRTGGGAELLFPNVYTGIGTRMGEVRIAADGTVESAGARIPTVTQAAVMPVIGGSNGSAGAPHSLVYLANEATDKLWFVGKFLDDDAVAMRPDLQIDDAHATNLSTPDPPRSGVVVQMTVPVRNTGAVASPATVCEVRYDTALLGTVVVPALDPGASADVTQDFTLPGGLDEMNLDVRFAVDPAGAVAEQCESNNVVDHRVTVVPRPSGTGILVVGGDETHDPSHTAEYAVPVDHFTVTLDGFASELGQAWSRTLATSAGSALFSGVPVGTYTLSAGAEGYNPPDPIVVQVARDAGDEYIVTASPSGVLTAWFDTWGSLAGTVWSTEGTPDPGDDVALSGATVRLRESGPEAVTSEEGAFKLDAVAAGSYTADLQVADCEPAFDIPVTITVAEESSLERRLEPTKDAWTDVRVTNSYGTPLSGVMIELRDASHAMLSYAVTGQDGRARVNADSTSIAYLFASKSLYADEEFGPLALAAGEVYRESITLVPTGGIGQVHSDWGRWILGSMHFEMNGNEWWGFWRNFHNRFDLIYREEGLDRYITQIDAYAIGKAFTWSCSAWQVDIDTPVGNIPELDWQIPVPQVGVDPSNVEVECVKVFDFWTGEELWRSSIADSWYSHDGVDEQNSQYYIVEDDEPGDGVLVPWSTAKVFMWVNVQKSVPGQTGSDGWTSMSTGGTGKAIVVWTPSTNQMYVQPWLFDPWD